MVNNEIHEPELPGVKTLPKDTRVVRDESDDMGITFLHGDGSKKLTTPEKVVESDRPMYKGDSILSNRDDVFNVSRAFEGGDIETGTIVSDKRRSKTSVGSMLIEAFNEWWGKTSKSVDSLVKKTEVFKREAPPTVSSPENRKGVIQEAAKFTVQVPRDDHHVIIEKVKTFAQDAERITGKQYLIKKTSAKTTPTWKHEVGETATHVDANTSSSPKKETVRPAQTLDLRKVAIAPVVEKRVSRDTTNFSFKPEKREPTVQKLEPVIVPRIPVIKRDTIAKDQSTSIAPQVPQHVDLRPLKEKDDLLTSKRNAETDDRYSMTEQGGAWASTHQNDLRGIPIPETQEQPVEEKGVPSAFQPDSPVPVSAPVSVSTTETIRPEVSVGQPLVTSTELGLGRRDFAGNTHSRLSPIILFTMVIVIGATLGTVAGIYYVKGKSTVVSETPGTMTIAIPAFFTAEAQHAIPLTGTREEFLAKLLEGVHSSQGGVTQFYPVLGDTTNAQPAETEAIVRTLSLHIPGPFERGLGKVMMLGSITTTKNEPFIILQSNNFDVSFAGMLSWEPYMSNDLSPLFGPSVTGAKDTPALFSDALRENKNIRILYDNTGSERIIYAFVNRNTIVITTSTEALSGLLSRLR